MKAIAVHKINRPKGIGVDVGNEDAIPYRNRRPHRNHAFTRTTSYPLA